MGRSETASKRCQRYLNVNLFETFRSQVNDDQTLRLHLACSPPAAVASGASFEVVSVPSAY